MFSRLSLLEGKPGHDTRDEPQWIPAETETLWVKSQRRTEVELDKRKPENFWNLLQKAFTKCRALTENAVMRAWGSQRRGAVVMDRPRGHRKERKGWMEGACRAGHLTCF